MEVPFEKWHGCKNDFLVFFTHPNQKELLEALKKEASQLCSRDGSSVGADGLLVLEFDESSEKTFYPNQLIIINQDGSLAANCGNGLRCAALACYKRALDYERYLEIPDSFELPVMDQKFLCHFSEKKGTSNLPQSVTISMGTPKIDEANSWHHEAVEAIQNLSSNSFQKISTCTLSNKHIVLETDQALDEKSFYDLASKLQVGFSWDGINVHLAKELNQAPKDAPSFIQQSVSLYSILHFERGVGPTQGCGSGASSLAASVFSDGFSEEGDSIGIKMPGGFVSVTYRGENNPLELTGPASFVFSGHIFL